MAGSAQKAGKDPSFSVLRRGVGLVVFRKGSWYVYTGDGLVSYKFGAEEDVPLSVVPVRDSMAGR